MNLPVGDIPSCTHPNNYVPQTREHENATEVRATVNSDYVGDTTHRKSVTGIIVMLVEVCVYYKTRFQATVSLSTTDAEFIVVVDAAKAILYICSTLDNIRIPQHKATTLYEEN